MRNGKRIWMHCILLLFLAVTATLAVCPKKLCAEGTGSIQIDESAVHDFSKKKDEELTGTASDKSEKLLMSEEATASLTEFRHEMDGTTYLFAAAYLGYVGEPTEHPAEWIQEICPQIMEDYPFIEETSGNQIVGSIGDLYCIVPRDAQTRVMIRQMIDEEDAAGGAKKAGDVLYQGEAGMPILLFCNEFRYWDRADVEISVEGTDGKQAVWQPMLDEAEYIDLPQNGDGEFLAMDFTYYPDGDTNFGDVIPMGWYAPELEDLRETTWSTYQDSGEGERTIYYLDLYGNEQADYGEYDGETCFAWQYSGDKECQEYYEGWWSLKEVEEQVCLCLDICRIGGLMYREGEEPKVISNQFPVLCDTEKLSMILHKGLRNGKSLPFLNEETTFEFLTQPVGNPDQDTASSGIIELKPRENTSPKKENQRDTDTENCVHVQWAKDVLTDLSDYERFRLGLDEEPPLIYFSTERTIEDFKELSLTFESIGDDGNIRFAVEETYYHGTLTPESPLLVRMELIGTIPNNGISYVDSSGKTRYFAVEVSGYDGSLLLSEFEPQM